jgi:hypothetical protein
MRLLVSGLIVALLLGSTPGRAEETPPEPPLADYDRDHWSFQPIARPALPQVQNAARCRTEIDQFLLAALEKKSLRPLPEADRLVLLRRAAFDLTGLPPTVEEIDEFLHDDSPDAYERAVDRYLASPHYGEHWAQHWLDLARFAETDGFEHDKVRLEAWRYRDWVIRALNADLPYDEFVSQQLAGDELRPDDRDSLLATGFLLAGPDMPDINLQEERRHEFFNGMTANVGEVLLGLQFGCCQCHDHKTDPLSQYDFYRLRAFFDSLDVLGAMEKEGPAPTPMNAVPSGLRVARNARSATVSHLAIRGDFRRPGPEVPPRFPRVIDAEKSGTPEAPLSSASAGRRTALAEWMTSSRNPLTARVIVNRAWQHYFGVGLVETSSDFGLMGSPPTHPELLDWLASELVRTNWSLKSLHRRILTSSVYRTASRLESTASHEQREQLEQLMKLDPRNELLGRMRRKRLDGESIRDAILAVSDQLNTAQGGPGVRPPLPAEVTGTLLKGQWDVTKDASQHSRRSVYLFARRNLRLPLLEAFDKPDTNISCPRRMQTTIAPQALHLINSGFAHKAAAGLAKRTSEEAADPAQRIRLCYQLLMTRLPTQEEEREALEFLADASPESWTDFCLALLNTNEFLYVD